MSESVGGVTADAPTAAPVPVSPPASSQPALTISDAARMLRSARPAPQQAAAPPEAPAAQEPPAAPAEAAPKRASGVEAMERALGITPDGAETGEEPAAEPAADAIEFDGRRWSHDELRKELSMAQDYTHKTQEIARQRQELQSQQAMLAQVAALYQPQIEQLAQQFQQVAFPDPALRHTDPASYWDQFARAQEAQVGQQRLMQMQAMQEQARHAALAQQVEQGNKVLSEKYEQWRDPATRRVLQDGISEWALQNGYTREMLAGLANPIYLETLMKAWAFDSQMSKTRTSAPQPQVRSAPPRGSAPPPRPAEQVAAAAEAFNAKPSWQNGAALLTAQQTATRRSGNGHSNW